MFSDDFSYVSPQKSYIAPYVKQNTYVFAAELHNK